MEHHKRAWHRAFSGYEDDDNEANGDTTTTAGVNKRTKGGVVVPPAGESECMSAVVDHALLAGLAIQRMPMDPPSVLARHGALLARFVTPETRTAERARLHRVVTRLRCGQMLPSQVCPGVSDCCDYARAQILIECEDQLRALCAVLGAATP